MKPEQFRELSIKPQARIGLYGDHDSPSIWSNNKQIFGYLQNYIVVQQFHPRDRYWDAGSIVMLENPLPHFENDGDKTVFNRLLLLQRYPNLPWDDGIVVLVFGIDPQISFEQEPFTYDNWVPKTVRLSFGAILTVEDGSRPSSEYSEFMRKHVINKRQAE